MVTAGEHPVSQLPWPAEWSSRKPKWLALMIFLALLAVGLPVGGILAVAAGDYGVGVLLLMASPLLFTATVIGFLTRLRIRRGHVDAVHSSDADEVAGPVLVIPYSRAVGVAGWMLVLALIVCWGFFALISGVGVAGSGLSWGPIAFNVVSLLFTLYGLALLVGIVRGKLARGKLALSPARIHHRSWAFSSSCPWENILSVSAAELDGPIIRMGVFDDSKSRFQRTSRLWKQAEFRLAPAIVVKTAYLSADPALAYHALRFYHEHPEARAELGTPAAVERLRRADLP